MILIFNESIIVEITKNNIEEIQNLLDKFK